MNNCTCHLTEPERDCAFCEEVRDMGFDQHAYQNDFDTLKRHVMQSRFRAKYMTEYRNQPEGLQEQAYIVREALDNAKAELDHLSDMLASTPLPSLQAGESCPVPSTEGQGFFNDIFGNDPFAHLGLVKK